MEQSNEVEYLNKKVREYFTVYDLKVFPEYLEFHIIAGTDSEAIYKKFDELWLNLKAQNFIPTMNVVKGEYIIQIVKVPERKFRSIYLNVGLLIATLISTVVVGMQNYAGYFNYTDLWTFGNFVGGVVFFALPLMAILGIHEMGHYFAAKKHHVRASLPFFIPAPTIIGTMGAFISMRDPIPNRRALLDIGLAGPIAGFAVTIIVAIVGSFLGRMYPPRVTDASTYLVLQLPFLYNLLDMFLPQTFSVFPTAFAAWVGFLVTAINLFPIGQLDGGHISRALFGEYSKYISYIFIGILIFLGFFYIGWLLFGLFVLILGLRHPPALNDITKLNKKRIVAGALGFVLLMIAFSPIPIQQIVLHENLELSASTQNVTLIENYVNSSMVIVYVKNTGDKMINTTIQMESTGNLNITYPKELKNIPVNGTESFNIYFNTTKNTVLGKHETLLNVTTVLEKVKRQLFFNINVYKLSTTLKWSSSSVNGSVNSNITLVLNNTKNQSEYISQFQSSQDYNISSHNVTLIGNYIEIRPGSSITITFQFHRAGVYEIYAITKQNYVAIVKFSIS